MDTPDTPATFFDKEDTVDPEILPPPPITDEVVVPRDMDPERRIYSHVFQHGTTLSDEWDEPWTRLVVEAEADQGRAICGAKRRAEDLEDQDMTAEEVLANPLLLVCKSTAGVGTDHPGEGRCILHGGMLHLGTVRTGRFSLLKHNKLAPRVAEFLEAEELLDTRNAIAVIYASLDAVLGEGDGEYGEITPQRAQEIGNLMTKVGALTKIHNEIVSNKQINIEVPEFMGWAEYFYELAIKFIAEGKGDVNGFLTEAQQFFNATVSLTIGDAETQAEARRDSAGALGQGGNQ